MTGSLRAAAISRLDGEGQDGVHLLWTPPATAGHSTAGFSVQRRPAWPGPEALCFTLDAGVLAGLETRGWIDTPQGPLSLRRVDRRELIGLGSGGVSTHVPEPFYLYELELHTGRPLNRIAADTPYALTILLLGHEAVATREGDPHDLRFAVGPVDKVLLYARSPLQELTVCVDDEVDEEQEWKNVPYLVTGLQLPVSELLSELVDELATAQSRAFADEQVDPDVFAEVMSVVKAALNASGGLSPVSVTQRTRADPADPFHDVQAWPFLMSLTVSPLWRRVLGLGWTDTTAVPGAVYDYRITGGFRRHDVEETLYGFHNVPLGMTLPTWFGLGPFHCRTRTPSTVAFSPDPPPGALRHAGRKGLPITPDSPLDVSLDLIAQQIVLDLAPGHSLTASAYDHPPDWNVQVPAGGRAVVTFPQPVSRVTLTGTGFLHGLRVPASSGDPDEIVTLSAVLRGVRHEGSQPPSPPAFLNTINLQTPSVPHPLNIAPSPPSALGFRLRWLPPYSEGPTPWPTDLNAHPPTDALAFVIERRRADTNAPYAPLEPGNPLIFGNRTARGEIPPMVPGSDLAALFPDARPPEAPVTVLMDLDDVLVTERTGGPPPGSLHQYRIFSVDVIGRRSATAATGPVVRLEKHSPPPRPVAPPPVPGTAEPSGVRARVLRRDDEGLSADDLDHLGTAANAVVLTWGWTAEERARDPLTSEFRVYWQPAPPAEPDGSELRPPAWAERVAELPVTADEEYTHVLHDRLTPDATTPLKEAWIGVSAADAEPYVSDEFPGGSRPGNESSVVPVVVQSRYKGRPVFSVVDPLPDVPEHVTSEPVLSEVSVTLNLPALQVPPGHRLQVDRIAVSELITRLGITADDSFRLSLPEGTTAQWSLNPPADHDAFLEQIRGGSPGRIETRFLMDALLRHRPALETLWHAALPSPVPYGTVSFNLPDAADRYFLRVRLADQAGHLSAEAAVLPLAVRVPSLRPPGTPTFTAVPEPDGTVTVSARTGDAFDLKWLLLFAHETDTTNPTDPQASGTTTVLRLPNRRDLYPHDGIRLRLPHGVVLAPQPFETATGTPDPPYRQMSLTLSPMPEKRLTLWAVALTRDGIPSSPSAARTVLVPPGPLDFPELTVTAVNGHDEASWSRANGIRLWALERSLDGTAWTQVTPWLPAHRITAVLELPPSGPRRYRLAAQGTWSRSGHGDAVTLP